MTQVKEHNGVKIFVSTQGEFYCDPINNSMDYKNKVFASAKLQSIEKAIDEFNGNEIDGNSYYDITVYNAKIDKLKVIRKTGNRLFFSDGSDTAYHARKFLYPESISSDGDFKDITNIIEQIKESQTEIKSLLEKQKGLKNDAEKILSKFKKVKVT